MTRRQLHRRLRARLDGDQRGFTLIETVIAITIMFGALVSLGFVVTSSFAYQRVSRIRQTATGLANQTMEEIRGLAYDKIKAGMLSTDLNPSTDSNLKSCSGVYRFYACNATTGSVPGTAEPIVSSPGLSPTAPIVPHLSTTSTNTSPVIDGVLYHWATYITRCIDASNMCEGAATTSTTAPYRVTVHVSWDVGVGPASYVRIQSFIWSPQGCRGTDTHPYATPCQPFFYGQATIPQGLITIASTPGSVGLNDTEFDSAVLSLPGVTSSVEQEQVVQSTAEFRRTSIALTTDGVTTTSGGTVASAVADSDPGTATGSYQQRKCGVSGLTCEGVPPTAAPSSSAVDLLTVSTSGLASAESDAATNASSSSICPPSNVSVAPEADQLACAASSLVPAGATTAAVTLGSTSPAVSAFNLLTVAAPVTVNPAPLQVFANRVTNPASTTVCSPATKTDGCLSLSASRTLGTISIGELPSLVASPPGWTGQFVQIVGYSDSAEVAVGTNALLASTSPTPAPGGQLVYYDGATYQPVNLSAASLATLAVTQSVTGGPTNNVRVTMTLTGTQASSALSSTTSDPTTPTTMTQASATVTAPVFTVRYMIEILTGAGAGSFATVLDLTTTVDLGALDVDASYAAKPIQGG